MFYSNAAKERCKADGELEASRIEKLVVLGLFAVSPCDCLSFSEASPELTFLRLELEKAPFCELNHSPGWWARGIRASPRGCRSDGL